MRIEHSALFNQFISFWFETYVDKQLRYETIIYFEKEPYEWFTQVAGDRSDGLSIS